jgi:CheY-like chemotaxis protein
MPETKNGMMKTQFFLYDYSVEEKQIFLDKVVSCLEDLIFVFELQSFNVIFHNSAFNSFSNWDKILSAPNFFESIRKLLNPNDLPALVQLSEKINVLEYKDIIVRDLHIKNSEQVFCHYQIEMSLFNKSFESPVQVMCKVHTLQNHLKGKELLKKSNGYSKIILVDDDVLTNILNEKIIKTVQPFIEIEVFLSVDEALEWLKGNDESGEYLIFLDINFPGRNGWDFMRSYDEFTTQSKVIVLSSSIVPSDRVKALNYKNVIQYMCKPLSFEIVETLLN